MKHYLNNGEYLHFTQHKSEGNKMDKMMSLNTSTKENPFCQKMRKNKDLICATCYAYTLESFRKKITPPFAKNGELLSRKLKSNEIPILNSEYVRFNAFGELLNKTHFKNLLAIVEANPHVNFALWSKRANIIKSYLKRFDNLTYVYSSPRVNVIDMRYTDIFDKIFTVFNIHYIRENAIDINCKASCYTCGLCYNRNDVKFIHEQIRSA